MTDKQINKWLRRRFSQVGWVLVGYNVLMSLLVSLCTVLDEAKQWLTMISQGNFYGDLDWDAILGNAWGYLLTILVGFMILHAWKGGDYWKSELLVKEKSMRPGVFFCMLCFCVGSQMLNSIWINALELLMNRFGGSLIPLLESIAGGADTFSMFLYSAILAPIAEEVLFRGYVLRSLQPYGKRFAILGSAILFGLFHGNLLQTPYAILMGLILGYVTVEYSIGWSVAIHMFNNLVLADLFTRLTAGLSDMAYGLLDSVIFGGGLVISLVILVRKRQEIREYNSREWMDKRVLKCFFTNSGILVLSGIMVYSMISLLMG